LAEELGISVEFSADYADILRGLDRLIDRTNDTAKALEGAGVNVDKLDRQLNTARKTLVDNARGQQELGDSSRKTNSALQEQIDRIRQLNRETRALSDARKQLRSNLGTNLSFIPANTAGPRVGSSFGNIVDQDDKRAQQASRSYLNLSTAIDQTIESKEREAKVFGAESRARWQQLVTDQKAAEKGTRDFEAAQRAQESALIRTRYALYDVAASYAAISAATLGAVTATGVLSAKYESAFTEIERTTLDSAGNISGNIDMLREDFLDLSEVIPLSFQELTKIGSLGAQLGIAEKDLVAFTETVAEFSRLSGVSAEESALAFGRIGELLDVPATEYRNLGSAIAYVATESAATDAQIISLTKELAASAGAAGFSASEVVGLGGALASLGVAPERARGALSTYFGTLNQAVAEGGEKLENFAVITGLTADSLRQMVKEGRGAEVLERFAQGLNSLDTVQVTTALDALGLSQLRVEDTFRRLGQNVGFVREQLGNAERAFESGTFLGDAFSVVLDDVASQFQLVLNSALRFVNAAGLPMLEVLRQLLPVVAAVASGMADFAESAAGQDFLRFAGYIAVAVGVLTGLRSVLSLATASIFALRTATGLLGGTGVVTLLRNMVAGLAGVGPAASKGAAGVSLLTGAIRSLFRATIILGAIAIAFDLITNEGKDTKASVDNIGLALRELSRDTLRFEENWQAAWANNAEAIRSTYPALGGLIDLLDQAFKFAARVTENLVAGQQAALDTLGVASGRRSGGGSFAREEFDFGESDNYYENMAQDFITSAYAAQVFGGAVDDAAGGLGGMGDAAREAAEEVRTLLDYGSDLASVFGRAFDLRFGTQLAVDGIADQWDNLADRIRQARLEIQGLTAERDVKEYFLSVANAYGDELRAGKLRAEISEINEKIADTQADASTELEGNSKAARNNRKVLSDLAKGYEDYIVQLAESGADQATLNAAVDRSEQEFQAQARALGFSNAQLQPYIGSFRGLKTVIDAVPRNITIALSADPAIQAIREFSERARIAAESVAALRSASSSPIRLGTASDTSGILKQINAEIALREGRRDAARAERLFAAANEQQQAIYALQNARNRVLAGYASGGYTGAGGKYEPAGIVHKGEYVVPKSQVNQRTGLPYANALGNLQPGVRSTNAGYASGGMVGGSMGIMELGPKSLNVLREAIRQEVVVAVDSREIARASARGSAQITREGGRLNG
jgi:TP901 family phage tail tape measure protein